jgi:hypothetical protein
LFSEVRAGATGEHVQTHGDAVGQVQRLAIGFGLQDKVRHF